MNVTKKYEVWPRTRPIMEGIRSLVTFLEKRERRLVLSSPSGICFSTREGRSISSNSLSEVSPLIENVPMPRRWALMATAPKDGARDHVNGLRLFLDHDYLGAQITVDSEDLDLLEAVFREIERGFGYEELPHGSRRIRWNPQATALVGCHFDEQGKKAGHRLQRFLKLIGFARVDIAEEVRASPIQDKVRDLLDPVSFYIGVVTGKRDHAWISAESGYAIAKDKEVILITQDGSDFNPTFFGRDRERLTFTNIIDEAFIGLLEDLRSREILGF